MKESYSVIPALLSKTDEDFEEKLTQLSKFADVIHVDLADGIAVPNRTVNLQYIFETIKSSRIILHMMVIDPAKQLTAVGDLPQSLEEVIVHPEFTPNIYEVITYLKEKEIAVSLALSPLIKDHTTLTEISQYLELIKSVMFMPIIPGFIGQPFRESVLEDISIARKYSNELEIAVDGGINPGSLASSYLAGARIFYASSYVLRSGDPEHALEELRSVEIDSR